MSNDTQSPVTEADLQKKIEQLQRAEEDVRRLQDELIDAAAFTRKPALAAIREAILEGLGEGEGVEASIALVPLAEILGELEGPDVCDLLVDILSSEEPEVRLVAGRALLELAYDRFKEVAEAAERAVTRLPADSQALRELPYVIAEVGEPGAPKILRGYLGHKDAEVVASAIEALASSGDPAGIVELRKLSRDPRTVQVDDEGAEGQVSIGALAQEALTMLESGADAPGPAPKPSPQQHSARNDRGPAPDRRGPPPPARGGGGRRR